MHYIRAVSPSRVVHYLKLDPDNKEDLNILDKLIDRKWEIEKSNPNDRQYIPIKSLYERIF